MCSFFDQAIYLLAKIKQKKLKFWPSCLLQEILAFFVGWIGNQEPEFAGTFHNPSLSGQETDVSIFCWSTLSFTQNQAMKFENLMMKFLLAGKNLQILNLIGWLCLKDKLLEQKIDTSVSRPDTEELWKVSANSELWFWFVVCKR